MGYSITWCAIREEHAEEMLLQLGWSPTGATEEFPKSRILAGRLRTGWRVIWYNKYDCPSFQPERLAALSKSHELVLCHVEEHVMASSAEYWSGGKRIWWLSHHGESGPKGLDVDGALPEAYPSIRNQLEDTQRAEGGDDADVDYIFEIPLKVAQSVVGFKHDDGWDHVVDERMMVLAQSKTHGKGISNIRQSRKRNNTIDGELYSPAWKYQKKYENLIGLFIIISLLILLWISTEMEKHKIGGAFTNYILTIGIFAVIAAGFWFTRRRQKRAIAHFKLTCPHCGYAPKASEISVTEAMKECQKCYKKLRSKRQ